MPVASWKPPTGPTIGPKQIHAPKEASLKGWWNAARKAMPDLPLWAEMRVGRYCGVVSSELIHIEWPGGDLFIARQRNMR